MLLGEREAFEYSFGAASVEFTGCTGTSPQPFEVDLDTSMTPLGTVEYRGKTYAKFQTSDTSPLVLLGVYEDRAGMASALPFSFNGQTLVVTPTVVSRVKLTTELVISGRRGVESTPIAPISQLRIRPRSHPGLIGTSTLELGFDVSVVRDCTVHGATLVLDELPATLLATPGSTGGEKALDIDMTCSHDNIPVELTLTDAHAPAATGSLLAAAPGSDAAAVQIELTRNGLPVQLGTPWSYGSAQTGSNPITLGARYARTAGTLVAGEIKGEEILQADYP